jgi:hypothetical protein
MELRFVSVCPANSRTKVKYVSRIIVTDTMKNFGKGLGTPPIPGNAGI